MMKWIPAIDSAFIDDDIAEDVECSGDDANENAEQWSWKGQHDIENNPRDRKKVEKALDEAGEDMKPFLSATWHLHKEGKHGNQCVGDDYKCRMEGVATTCAHT